MPSFTDPYYGNVPRKMTITELIRALRLDVAAEEEATALYEAHADATDNPIAKKVFLDVANEERVHVGEFNELINILTAYEEQAWINNGAAEVREMAEEVARGDLELATPAEKAAEEGISTEDGKNGGDDDRKSTIGSMRS
jgi:uncharacterized protein